MAGRQETPNHGCAVLQHERRCAVEGAGSELANGRGRSRHSRGSRRRKSSRRTRRTQVSGRCSGDSQRGSKHQEVGTTDGAPVDLRPLSCCEGETPPTEEGQWLWQRGKQQTRMIEDGCSVHLRKKQPNPHEKQTYPCTRSY